MPLIPVAEFAARHWRISRQKAYDRIKRIGFEVEHDEHGRMLVDEDKLLAAYRKNRNPAQDYAPRSPRAENVSSGEDFQAARTRREIAEANKAELEQAILEGKYAPVEDGKLALRQCGAIYAAARNSLPTALAPLLVGKTLAEIQQILKQALRDVDIRAADEIARRFGENLNDSDEHGSIAV